MNILVLGRHGQLGQSLKVILPKAYPNSIFWDRQNLDLQQLDGIEHQLTAQRPDVIVNATAYTAVDQAESNKELAFAINQHAVGRVADYCAKNNVPLLHVSTDYVFDGLGQQPYVETDEPNPAASTVPASSQANVLLPTAAVGTLSSEQLGYSVNTAKTSSKPCSDWAVNATRSRLLAIKSAAQPMPAILHVRY